MIELSKIDKNLSVYKKNHVILFGANEEGVNAKHLLEKYGITIDVFTDSEVSGIGDELEGVTIMSVSDCEKYILEHSDYIIQIIGKDECRIAEQLKEKGLTSYIYYSDFKGRLEQLNWLEACRKEPEIKNFLCDFRWWGFKGTPYFSAEHYLLHDFLDEDYIRLMWSAPKVGNTTMMRSFKNKEKRVFSMLHSFQYVNEGSGTHNLLHTKPVKLIIGVRDVIKQNLSLMYQIWEYAYWDMEEFWNEGGDAERIFHDYIITGMDSKPCNFRELKERAGCDYLVQNFFDQQLKPFFGVDIYQYPFDKEKGYSVYHISDKLDIMVYQLEKMNYLADEIGKFFNIEDFEVVVGNDSNQKWYKEFYTTAEQNMPLSRKYFEMCYSSRFMNHFYNEQDIEKFKQKWIGQVRD